MFDKKVTIIIANYNGQYFLDSCFRSIEKSNYKNFTVCVVDDGSTDRSIDIIRYWSKKIQIELIIQSHKGASSARNTAISRYKGISDVLIFLDNDTEVTPVWIDEIIKTLYSSESVGGAQSLLIDFEKRDQIQVAGISLIPHTCWGIGLLQGEEYEKMVLTQARICAISACLAVKTEIFSKVQPFDELLAVSTEDLDFTWRIWLAGYEILLSPKSLVYHYTKNMSQRKDMDVNNYIQYFHLTKNSIRTLIKNYSLRYLIYYLPQSIIINFLRALLVMIKRKDISAIKAFFSAVWWNLVLLNDTLMNRKLIQKNRVYCDPRLYKIIMSQDTLFEIYEKHFKKSGLL